MLKKLSSGMKVIMEKEIVVSFESVTQWSTSGMQNERKKGRGVS